jgi:hypothetical protein
MDRFCLIYRIHSTLQSKCAGNKPICSIVGTESGPYTDQCRLQVCAAACSGPCAAWAHPVIPFRISWKIYPSGERQPCCALASIGRAQPHSMGFRSAAGEVHVVCCIAFACLVLLIRHLDANDIAQGVGITISLQYCCRQPGIGLCQIDRHTPPLGTDQAHRVLSIHVAGTRLMENAFSSTSPLRKSLSCDMSVLARLEQWRYLEYSTVRDG